MKNVVQLSGCRDLLQVWAAVRAKILSGEIRGIAICELDWQGRESVTFAGDYRDDPEAALKAALSLSWELTKGADFKNSQ